MRTGNFIRARISPIVRFRQFILNPVLTGYFIITLTYRFNISFDLKSFCLGSKSCDFFSVFEIIGGIGAIEEISGFFDGFNFDVGSTFVFGSFD